MDELAEDLAELDDQISQFEHLLALATENEFWALAGLLSRDLAEARLWRAVFTTKLHPSEEASNVGQ